MVTRDDDSQNIYTVPVGQFNQQTSVEDYKYEEKRENVLIVPGEYISKKEPRKISKNKTMCLYIVPAVATLLYQQGNQNSFILLSLESELNYMGVEYTSEYIIRRKKNLFWISIIKVGCTFSVIFLWNIKKKKKKKDPIIVLRNGIHPIHMIYFGISILIQLCIFY